MVYNLALFGCSGPQIRPFYGRIHGNAILWEPSEQVHARPIGYEIDDLRVPKVNQFTRLAEIPDNTRGLNESYREISIKIAKACNQ